LRERAGSDRNAPAVAEAREWWRCVGADAYAFVMVAGTLREWLAAHPPPDASFRQTLALVSDRVRAREDVRFAVREFLDEFYLLPRDDLRVRAIRSSA
jgi:hypothetical protein